MLWCTGMLRCLDVKCNKGDLALVILGKDMGKVVSCIEIETPTFPVKCRGVIWKIDRQLHWKNMLYNFKAPYCPEYALIPIGKPKTSLETSRNNQLEFLRDIPLINS